MSASMDFSPAHMISTNLFRTKYKDMKIPHWCEKCGKEELLTPEEGFEAGYDGPWMYGLGSVSPRTCGNCSMEGTVWWKLAVEHKTVAELSESELKTLDRILNEGQTLIKLAQENKEE